jgi:hypothetical protein
VNLEVELDSTLINDPERFHDRIRQVFRLAQQAIDNELGRQQGPAANTNGSSNGHSPTNGNGHSPSNGKPRANGRKATASQVRALHAIANRQGIDLTLTLQERYGIDHAEDLGIGQASELIDELKNTAAGGRR